MRARRRRCGKHARQRWCAAVRGEQRERGGQADGERESGMVGGARRELWQERWLRERNVRSLAVSVRGKRAVNAKAAGTACGSAVFTFPNVHCCRRRNYGAVQVGVRITGCWWGRGGSNRPRSRGRAEGAR